MKKRKILVVIGLALLVVALSATWLWFFYTPLGRLVRGTDFEGIILDPAKYPTKRPLTNVWGLAPDHIYEMESRLKKHVRDNEDKFTRRIVSELSSYRRSYLGVTDDNKKFIRAFFCHSSATSRHDWLRYHLGVMGGGDLYWYITYDVASRNFSGFLHNMSE